MFGWANASRRPAHSAGGHEVTIHRCEACGLGVSNAAAPVDLRSALGEEPDIEGPNRASLQASLGARGWAPIDPGRRIYPTPAAAEPIAKRLGGRAERVRTPLNPTGIWGMWQTLVNAFTLGHNVITDARHGRLSPADGRQRAAIGLDLLVSVLVALPMLLIALVLETAAAAVGRGGVTRFRVET